MSNQKKGFTDEELKMMAEMESLIAEMNQHPEVMNEPLPENLHKELWRDIREYKEEQAEAVSQKPEPEVARLTDEEKELIQLGRIYKRKKKNKKFYVLIAAIIGAMTFGITSMGGPEKVFEKFNWMLAGREQTNIDSESDDIEKPQDVKEEELYQQIEDEYGFWPVKLDNLPKGVEFLDAAIYKDIETAEFIFGKQGVANITFQINMGYREGSIGMDIEDKVISQYEIENERVMIDVKEYYLQEYKESRWLAEFKYQNIQYFVKGTDISKEEFEDVLKNLYFL